MTKQNTAYGTLYTNHEFDLVALWLIRTAIEAGWSEVVLDEMISLSAEDKLDELFAKRDEALAWLNANTCEDNVHYEYFELVEDIMVDGEEQEVPIAGYGLYESEV